jgi:hypothetical protein
MFGIKKKPSRKQQIEDYIASTKHESLETKVYKALKKAGKRGLWNSELAMVGKLSWHRRIGNLRADGVNIQSVHIKGSGWKYYLNED